MVDLAKDELVEGRMAADRGEDIEVEVGRGVHIEDHVAVRHLEIDDNLGDIFFNFF